MNNDQIVDADAADALLAALAEQLGAAGQRYDLVVVGGSALLALELVQRPTRDVDVTPDRLNSGPARLLDFGLAYFGVEDADLDA
jgi:hypothetical protein